MSFALRLYERFRVLIHEAAKFGVVGLAGFIVSLGGADVLRYGAGVGKYKAVIAATVLATVVTFVGNRYWAFRHRERTGMGRETVLFFVFNGIGLLIQLACVAIVQDGLNLQGKIAYNAANLVGIGLGTLFRFWSYRKWVWRTQDPAAGVQAGHHRPAAPASGLPEAGFAENGFAETGFPESGLAEAVAVGLDEEATLYGRGAEEYGHGTGNYAADPEGLDGERGQYAGNYDRRADDYDRRAEGYDRRAEDYDRRAGDYGRDGGNGSRPGRHAARS